MTDSNSKLYNSIKKYGKENFKKTKVTLQTSQENIDYRGRSKVVHP